MSQKSSRSSSRSRRVTRGEINDWTNLIENLPMEPLEREIYEEHIRAMKEFEEQKAVDPLKLPSTTGSIIDELSPGEDEKEQEIADEIAADAIDEMLTQREKARKDFEQDEEFHASQFRKSKDWNMRKRLALENLEQPIDLATDVMELLLFGTPIQLVNKVPDPDIPEIDLIGVFSLYLTPECVARDQLFVDNETPLSLSLDVNPMGRNVFEIICGDDNMTGFPISYKSVVYIKVHYNEDNRDFFLTVDISSPYTVGKLYVQDKLDDLCQFQFLSVNQNNNKNQELIDLNMPVLIKHIKTGFYIMSKVNITVMNICGEEKCVVGSDEIDGNNLLWKLIYGSFNDDLEFDLNSYVTERWWQPKEHLHEYIPATIKKNSLDSPKPSTSQEHFEPVSLCEGYSRPPLRHSYPEFINNQWVEVHPGLQRSTGPPGSANDVLDNAEELFTRIKRRSQGRKKKDFQQIVFDFMESLRDVQGSPLSNNVIKELLSKLKTSEIKALINSTDSVVDFIKRLNPKWIQENKSNPVRDNRYAKQKFLWPKAPEITTMDDTDRVIDAMKKLNPNLNKNPDFQPPVRDKKYIKGQPTIIEEVDDEIDADVVIGGNKSDDYTERGGQVKPDDFAGLDLTVTHLESNDVQKIDHKVAYLNGNVPPNGNLPMDGDEDKENFPRTENDWNSLSVNNPQLAFAQDDSDAESFVSTLQPNEGGEADMELEDTRIGGIVSHRLEEGQGDVYPRPDCSNHNS